MTTRYAELDNVLYRAQDGRFYGGKLVGGKWVPNYESAKVRRDAMPMTEAEAKAWAGDEWPQEVSEN